ncbi:MAG: hypothetical protein ABI166_15485 [Mucilaginibacter sp.]
MRILIIAMNVGRTAPGIVYERLIHGLSKVHTIDVLTSDFNPSIELKTVNKIISIKRNAVNRRFNTLSFLTLGINLIDWFWTRKAVSHLKKQGLDNYDLVFSFVAYNNFAPLIAGDTIARSLNIKHMVYAVDALPPPIGWLEDDLFYKKLKGFISEYVSKVDGIFSANEKMLTYQLTNFKHKTNLITGVIYNPSFGDVQNYTPTHGDVNTFLYTGGIYGPRKCDYILAAFKKILIEYPNSVLEFVGSIVPEKAMAIFNLDERKKVLISPFANDLTSYYERSTALLDIDADLPDDIYLSSKMVNYIKINRIIITETGINSPSRGLFKDIPSIIQCNHNVDEIAGAMRKAIQLQGVANFGDRSKVIGLFDLNNIIEKINSSFGV